MVLETWDVSQKKFVVSFFILYLDIDNIVFELELEFCKLNRKPLHTNIITSAIKNSLQVYRVQL